MLNSTMTIQNLEPESFHVVKHGSVVIDTVHSRAFLLGEDDMGGFKRRNFSEPCSFCGGESKYHFKSGERSYCCESNVAKCPAIRKINSKRNKENPPSKNPEIAKKISIALTGRKNLGHSEWMKKNQPNLGKDKWAERKAKGAPLCKCKSQCGERTKWDKNKAKYNEYVHGHHARSKNFKVKPPDSEAPICKCGYCDEKTTWNKPKNDWNRFVKGHQNRGKNQAHYGIIGKKHPNYGRKRPDASEYMLNGGAAHAASFVKNPSKSQVELYKLIKSLYPDSMLNYPSLNRVIDIAIPDQMIAIEYDGSYWHQDQEADETRQKELEAIGWKFLRYYDYVPSIDELEKDLRKMQV